MQVLRRRAAVVDERERTSRADDVEALRPRVRDPNADGGRDLLVEPLRRLEVGDADPYVVDVVVARPRLLDVDRLRAVAVRVEEERAVVRLRVVRPLAGLAVARIDACAPERVDVGARPGAEGDVQVPR